MKYMIFLKNKFFSRNATVLLGRWNIVYCDKKINKKIDLSNEDHCGGCDIYKYKENKETNVNKIIFYENM
jgi:hypothetical protein